MQINISLLALFMLCLVAGGCQRPQFELSEKQISAKVNHEFTIVIPDRNRSISRKHSFEVLDPKLPEGLEMLARESFFIQPGVDGSGSRLRFYLRATKKGVYKLDFFIKPGREKESLDQKQTNPASFPAPSKPPYRSFEITVG